VPIPEGKGIQLIDDEKRALVQGRGVKFLPGAFRHIRESARNQPEKPGPFVCLGGLFLWRAVEQGARRALRPLTTGSGGIHGGQIRGGVNGVLVFWAVASDRSRRFPMYRRLLLVAAPALFLLSASAPAQESPRYSMGEVLQY
jgi:hypothetical protein